MLGSVAELFTGQLAPYWEDEMTDWGERVDMYREYVRGEHRVYMTSTMRKMLNVTGKKFETFSADYTDMVVRMMSERLVVERIEAMTPEMDTRPATSSADVPQMDDSGVPPAVVNTPLPADTDMDDPAQGWVDRLLKLNRFDGLQMDVHESTVRDGDCFIIVDFDEARQTARLNFNQAYDGDVGMIPIYSRSDPTAMTAAVKIFHTGDQKKQVNVYYANKVSKFTTDETGSDMELISTEAWAPKVLPVVHFSNRRRSGESIGVSELQKVITLQDILNRTLVSMVMTSEFSAFPVIFAKGFKPNAVIAPGDVMYYNEENPDKLQYADVKKIEESQLTGYIEEINKIIDLIAEVTQTPIASVLGTNPSGEALKQRESGLLTKIRGAHVKMGNAWEDVLTVAHAVESTFKAAGKPPAIEMFDCKWKDANVRSDGDVILQAGMVYDKLQNDRLYVEMVAAVTGWDEKKQQEIVDQLQTQAQQDFTMAASNLLGANGEFALNLNGVAA